MVSAHHSGTHPLKPWKGHTKHCCLHSQLSTEEKGGKTHDFRTSLQQSSAQTVEGSHQSWPIWFCRQVTTWVCNTGVLLVSSHNTVSEPPVDPCACCMFRLYMSSGTCTRSVSAWACIRSAATWRWSSLSWASALCRSSWSSLLCLSSWRLRAALCLFSWRLTAAWLSPSFNWEW